MAEMATRSTKATSARGSAQRYTLAPAGGRTARLDKMRSQPGTRWNRRGELSGSGSCWRRRGRPSNSALRGAATSLCRQNRAGELPRTDLRTAGRERFYVVAAPHRLQVVLQLLGKRVLQQPVQRSARTTGEPSWGCYGTGEKTHGRMSLSACGVGERGEPKRLADRSGGSGRFLRDILVAVR